MGRAKHWCNQTIGSMQGDWETLYSKFCLRFFLISKVVSLRKDVLNFRQLEEESLGTLRVCFNKLIITGLNFAIPDPILLQHFFMGLSKDSREHLNVASGGAFLHLSASECLIELAKSLPSLAFIMNSLRKRQSHLPNKKRKF
jgi:hypothetical protein